MSTDLIQVMPIEFDQAEYREGRKPWLAMSLLLVAASAERMLVRATGADAEMLWSTAALAFTTAVVIGHRSRHRLMGKHLRRRFMTAVWGAAGWLTYVAACGMTWGTTATLVAVGSVLSLLFWREHRIHGRPLQLPLELEPVEPGDIYVARWDANVAAAGKKLVGSKLTEVVKIGTGLKYTLELVPGVHTVGQVQGIKASLKGALRLLPGQDIIIETHPTEPEPTALITIVIASKVTLDQQWPGPAQAFDPTRGSVVMGPFVDGEGLALWSVYRTDGMFGGFIQGGIGSGKSRGIETIALACASSTSHPTTVWFGCGQDGASSPLLMGRANATATTAEQMVEMLRAAVAVQVINGVQNRDEGRRGFHPTADRPGLLIIVDEFHNFLDERQHGKLALEIQDLMVKIIREGRKAGVALLLATQEPLLPAFGHPSKAELMRSNLLVGNGVMMRSETNNAKQVFKVEVNARDFPDLPGYAFLARPFSGDRQAPFRFFYVNDAAITRWAGSFPWRGLSTLQASMVAQRAGRWYASRHALAAARAEEDARLLADLQAGVFTTLEPTQPEPRSQSQVRVTTGPAFGENMPGVSEVTKFWEQGPAAVHEPSAVERGMSDGQKKVLAALGAGHRRPAELVRVTRLSESQVHNVLGDLVRMNMIDKVGYGQYQQVA